MKKLVSMLTVGLMLVMMLCGCGSAVADEADDVVTYESGDYKYILLEDGTAQITGYMGNDKELVIPDSLDGKVVTDIASFSFLYRSALTEVTIPDSIISIGGSAFMGCKSLTRVTISKSLAKIGASPFSYCTSLTNIVVNPENATFAAIDGVLFRKTDKLLICYPCGKKSENYQVPDGIIGIANLAFYWCTNLKEVSIPDSVIYIGESAFYKCTSLAKVEVSNYVTQMGNNPFQACSCLKEIIVDSENVDFAAIDGVLFNKTNKTLISYPCGKVDNSYQIPEGTETIGEDAFYECSNLSEIEIPDSVTSIGNRAFDHCDSLTKVLIPSSVTSIEDETFIYCSALSDVLIPNSVMSIGSCVFYECSSLYGITIPESVIYMDKDAFAGCDNLTLTVTRDSYAAQYAEKNGIPYTYPDSNDWLNS